MFRSMMETDDYYGKYQDGKQIQVKLDALTPAQIEEMCSALDKSFKEKYPGETTMGTCKNPKCGIKNGMSCVYGKLRELMQGETACSNVMTLRGAMEREAEAHAAAKDNGIAKGQIHAIERMPQSWAETMSNQRERDGEAMLEDERMRNEAEQVGRDQHPLAPGGNI
jgi:hypothetical protein